MVTAKSDSTKNMAKTDIAENSGTVEVGVMVGVGDRVEVGEAELRYFVGMVTVCVLLQSLELYTNWFPENT